MKSFISFSLFIFLSLSNISSQVIYETSNTLDQMFFKPATTKKGWIRYIHTRKDESPFSEDKEEVTWGNNTFKAFGTVEFVRDTSAFNAIKRNSFPMFNEGGTVRYYDAFGYSPKKLNGQWFEPPSHWSKDALYYEEIWDHGGYPYEFVVLFTNFNEEKKLIIGDSRKNINLISYGEKYTPLNERLSHRIKEDPLCEQASLLRSTEIRVEGLSIEEIELLILEITSKLYMSLNDYYSTAIASNKKNKFETQQQLIDFAIEQAAKYAEIGNRYNEDKEGFNYQPFPAYTKSRFLKEDFEKLGIRSWQDLENEIWEEEMVQIRKRKEEYRKRKQKENQSILTTAIAIGGAALLADLLFSRNNRDRKESTTTLRSTPRNYPKNNYPDINNSQTSSFCFKDIKPHKTSTLKNCEVSGEIPTQIFSVICHDGTKKYFYLCSKAKGLNASSSGYYFEDNFGSDSRLSTDKSGALQKLCNCN